MIGKREAIDEHKRILYDEHKRILYDEYKCISIHQHETDRHNISAYRFTSIVIEFLLLFLLPK